VRRRRFEDGVDRGLRVTPPFSASATASPKAMISTMSKRLTAIFI